MQSAINCQKKTYQFNDATLSLRQVIGQVIFLIIIMQILYIMKIIHLTLKCVLFLLGILWSCIGRFVRVQQ